MSVGIAQYDALTESPRFSGFRPCVITSCNGIVSISREWFRRIGVRLRDWRASFRHCPSMNRLLSALLR